MNEHNKNEAPKPASTGSGSGSDPASKISAGTSVGNVGQSPMPNASTGGKPAGSASTMGASTAGGGSSAAGQGSSGGVNRAQSAPLASHNSKPTGGTGGTGASPQTRSPGASGSGGAMADQAKQATDQAKQVAGEVQEKAGELYEQASDWARDTYEHASDWASNTYKKGSERVGRSAPSMRSVRSAGSGVQRYIAENPVMVGIVGLAAGLLIGALLPRTRREDETFGEWSDEVREQGVRYAQDMAERGRAFVEEGFSGEDPRFAHHDSEFRPRNEAGGPNRH